VNFKERNLLGRPRGRWDEYDESNWKVLVLLRTASNGKMYIGALSPSNAIYFLVNCGNVSVSRRTLPHEGP
jgi:hypothetical protein